MYKEYKKDKTKILLFFSDNSIYLLKKSLGDITLKYKYRSLKILMTGIATKRQGISYWS